MSATKQIAWIVGFVALLIGGDRLLYSALTTAIPAADYRLTKMYFDPKPADLVIVGDSRADRHFPAKRLGPITDRSVVNLGKGGVSAVVSEALLKDYLEKVGNPGSLIVEVTNVRWAFETTGDLRILGVWSDRFRAMDKKITPALYWGGEIFNLLRLNNDVFFNMALGQSWSSGDRPFTSKVSKKLVRETRNGPDVELEIAPDSLQALRGIQAVAKERSIPLIFMVTPLLPDYRRKMVNYDDWLEQISAAIGGAPIHDYSEAVVDNAMFADRIHLNAEGLTRFYALMAADGLINAPVATGLAQAVD